MNLHEVLSRLGAPEKLDLFQPFWDESVACYPADVPSFLKPEEFLVSCDYGGLPPEAQALVAETARRVRESRELSLLAWHCQRLVFERGKEYPQQSQRQWPMLTSALGDLSPLFYTLVALTAVPRIRAFHESRGIPDKVVRATCYGVRHNADLFRKYNDGRWGSELRSLYWLRNHAWGDLYEVGRFQYMVKPFRPGQIVCRNRQTGETLALAEDGVQFRPDGFRTPSAPIATVTDGWTARLIEDKTGFTGTPISPYGRALRQEVHLPVGEWQCVMRPGDLILEMHIPAGGGMTLEASRASMQEALEFFPRHFPGKPFRGFACTSWIFSPNLEEFLPPESNLVRLLKEVYVYPVPSSPRCGLVFVFNQEGIDLATAPRDTSLRRAIVEQFERGGEMRCGGVFVLTEDFGHFGEQWYRSRWPPEACREAGM